MSEYNNKTDYSKYRVEGYPVRHKKKVPFQPILKLSRSYHESVKRIRDLEHELNGMILGDADYLELVNEAYASNIHWSVKIEGNNLSLGEVSRITALYTKGDFKEEVRGGPEQEILNHLHSFIGRNQFGLPWSMDIVCGVHSLLTKDTGTDMVPGELRTERAAVCGRDGFEYFIACQPGTIAQETESLLEWLSLTPYDEICTAALFFHEFESIHPFPDGNGRTGRTLFQILLQELGLKNSKLCKLERELLEDTETYYSLLAYTDKTADYGPLVTYFADALLRAYEEAVKAFSGKDRLKDMDEVTKTLAKKSKTVRGSTVTDACGWVPSVRDQTVRSRINMLVSMGILEKEGNTRSRVYRFKDPFKDLRG